MRKRNSGHIVNISSASGYLPFPGMTDYTASKGAIVKYKI